MAAIKTTSELRAHYNAPMERAVRKQLNHIDQHCARFISLSPFCLLSTDDGNGNADVSPRGDEAGFVHVLEPRTLALPDRPGNNRLDSLENIISSASVGLLFLVPGVQETLRINGEAEIRDDEELRAQFEVSGRLPATVLQIHVKEAYLHCAKSIMRSKIWDADTHHDRSVLPSMGKMLKDQIGYDEAPEGQEEMIERYKEILY